MKNLQGVITDAKYGCLGIYTVDYCNCIYATGLEDIDFSKVSNGCEIVINNFHHFMSDGTSKYYPCTNANLRIIKWFEGDQQSALPFSKEAVKAVIFLVKKYRFHPTIIDNFIDLIIKVDHLFKFYTKKDLFQTYIKLFKMSKKETMIFNQEIRDFKCCNFKQSDWRPTNYVSIKMVLKMLNLLNTGVKSEQFLSNKVCNVSSSSESFDCPSILIALLSYNCNAGCLALTDDSQEFVDCIICPDTQAFAESHHFCAFEDPCVVTESEDLSLVNGIVVEEVKDVNDDADDDNDDDFVEGEYNKNVKRKKLKLDRLITLDSQKEYFKVNDCQDELSERDCPEYLFINPVLDNLEMNSSRLHFSPIAHSSINCRKSIKNARLIKDDAESNTLRSYANPEHLSTLLCIEKFSINKELYLNQDSENLEKETTRCYIQFSMENARVLSGNIHKEDMLLEYKASQNQPDSFDASSLNIALIYEEIAEMPPIFCSQISNDHAKEVGICRCLFRQKLFITDKNSWDWKKENSFYFEAVFLNELMCNSKGCPFHLINTSTQDFNWTRLDRYVVEIANESSLYNLLHLGCVYDMFFIGYIPVMSRDNPQFLHSPLASSMHIYFDRGVSFKRDWSYRADKIPRAVFNLVLSKFGSLKSLRLLSGRKVQRGKGSVIRSRSSERNKGEVYFFAKNEVRKTLEAVEEVDDNITEKSLLMKKDEGDYVGRLTENGDISRLKERVKKMERELNDVKMSHLFGIVTEKKVVYKKDYNDDYNADQLEEKISYRLTINEYFTTDTYTIYSSVYSANQFLGLVPGSLVLFTNLFRPVSQRYYVIEKRTSVIIYAMSDKFIQDVQHDELYMSIADSVCFPPNMPFIINCSISHFLSLRIAFLCPRHPSARNRSSVCSACSQKLIPDVTISFAVNDESLEANVTSKEALLAQQLLQLSQLHWNYLVRMVERMGGVEYFISAMRPESSVEQLIEGLLRRSDLRRQCTLKVNHLDVHVDQFGKKFFGLQQLKDDVTYILKQPKSSYKELLEVCSPIVYLQLVQILNKNHSEDISLFIQQHEEILGTINID